MSSGFVQLCETQTEAEAVAVFNLLQHAGIDATIVRSTEPTMRFDGRSGSTEVWGEVLVAASDLGRAGQLLRGLQRSQSGK